MRPRLIALVTSCRLDQCWRYLRQIETPVGNKQLRALLPEPCGLRLLAGLDKGALCVGDLGRPWLAGSDPILRRVDVVATQEQRFRAAPGVPASGQFSESRVLANPVEVDPQRPGEL